MGEPQCAARRCALRSSLYGGQCRDYQVLFIVSRTHGDSDEALVLTVICRNNCCVASFLCNQSSRIFGPAAHIGRCRNTSKALSGFPDHWSSVEPRATQDDVHVGHFQLLSLNTNVFEISYSAHTGDRPLLLCRLRNLQTGDHLILKSTDLTLPMISVIVSSLQS